MRRRLLLVAATLPAMAGAEHVPVTFHKDVQPILQKRCQSCHRSGEIGPMALGTYAEARPWAKAIRQAVLLKKMPPWFADPRYGKFTNDPSLSRSEIDALVAWVDQGAPEGAVQDAPPPAVFADGWNIPEPDAVFEMPEDFGVPAEGVLNYQYFSVPTNFAADRWIQMAEVRPGNRAVVHHAIVSVRGLEEDGWRGARHYLAGYAPGAVAQKWPAGQARLLPAGATLVFQMHYTTNGSAGSDRTRIGLVFAKKPPERRIVAMTAANSWFRIPPHAADHQVESVATISRDAELVGMRAHMHLRGKSFEFRAVYPTGEREVLLRVPRYDFAWQPYYYLAKPIALPAGTRIECTATYDNSSNNPRNPDPSVEVGWGAQSWEEMMLGWFDIAVPATGR